MDSRVAWDCDRANRYKMLDKRSNEELCKVKHETEHLPQAGSAVVAAEPVVAAGAEAAVGGKAAVAAVEADKGSAAEDLC